ncbi:MAG: CotH kinase family protein [Oscillospiraceae bacterium]|nr:CotH kinase family protein [Oscillospiraceae bacterium]
MKKKAALICSLVLVFNSFGIIGASAALTGDVNDDGSVSAADAVVLTKYLLGKDTQEQAKNPDVNADSRVNVLDLICEKQILLSDGNTETETQAPSVSVESGFYKSDFDVELSADQGVKIYYTLDGTNPDENSAVYSGALHISDATANPNVYSAKPDMSASESFTPTKNVTKGTVLKAVSISDTGVVSSMVTKTYFVGIDIASQYNNMPVISVNVDPDDLFDYDKGIYTKGKTYDDWVAQGGNPFTNETWNISCNYSNKGEEWERKAHIELFENDGALAYEQDMGVRITGNASRSQLQKSLKFYSREEYGKKNVKYELIPDAKKELDDTTVRDKYKRFTLRSGANDNGYSKFKDNYIQSLVGDRDFETQSSRPVIVFLDGEYWGVYVIQEDYSDNYIKNNYDIPSDDVIIMECDYQVDDGVPEDQQLYDQFIDFAAQNDLSDDAQYSKINEMMDMQSFIDYYCTEIFIANQDWMNNNNNYRIWRSRSITDSPYQDGKWRWMLYDTEFSLGLYKNGMTYNEDSMMYALYGSEDITKENRHTVLFRSLIKNAQFRQQFATTFCDLMNKNLSTDHMLKVLDEFYQMYRPVMEEQTYRFGPAWILQWSKNPMQQFESEVKNMKMFIQNRPQYVYKMLQKYLEINGQTAKISVNVSDSSGGTVKVNTITPDYSTGSQWTGTYFTNYPVTVTAVPADGYRFTGWKGDIQGNETTAEMAVKEGASVTAVFEKE